MALLNFKFGSQAGLPSAKAPGTIYITKDTKKLFVDNPADGSTERICLGDFQLVSWTKSEGVTTPATALSNYSLKDANTLYITVESSTGATAMWRYSGTEFKAISNSEEIASIVAEISAINTALAGKAPTAHAVNANTYGLGTNGVYGHVKLTDATNTTEANGKAAKGIAASAYAVKLAYDRGSLGVTNAATAQAAAEAAQKAADAAQGTADAAVTAAEKAQGEVDALETVVAGKANTNHASSTTDYGTGSSSAYGHVKLTDATNTTQANGQASTGVAASAYAVKLAYDRGSAGVTAAGAAQTAAENAATAASNANTNAESRLPKASPTVTSGALTLAVETPTNKMHAASKGYVDTQDTATLNSAKSYTDAAKTAILGEAGYAGTVKGAYGAASNASTAASNAQSKADEAYTLAGKKTTTAEVKTQIEAYGYATTTVAQNKADAALASAKSYTDTQIGTVNSTINTLKSDIGNLSNIMNFLGTTTTEIADGSTKTINKPSAVTDATYAAKTGDVVVDSKGKECVFDGTVWRVIGDTSANSTAITALQNRMTTAEGEIDALQADVGTDDGKGALFGRVAALETWKGTHATEYSNLKKVVDGHTTAIGTADDDASSNASTTGSLYARVKKNASDISGHATRIGALESWKTSHSAEYTALANRVTALETWKGTHTTAFNNLSTSVSGNTTAINNLTTVLTWGTF